MEGGGIEDAPQEGFTIKLWLLVHKCGVRLPPPFPYM